VVANSTARKEVAILQRMSAEAMVMLRPGAKTRRVNGDWSQCFKDIFSPSIAVLVAEDVSL
jgi:hypothetical protein